MSHVSAPAQASEPPTPCAKRGDPERPGVAGEAEAEARDCP